ncbi:cell division FtsA domain-containing protein [Odoribacter lunatus]|uniref:cell division FtsA domain-containing protein n=1 Tax=Odoribacter lunatus TaxID=2941335 RepID=UPI00203C8DBC|nr:cell division FtsA domain-containing protein [Odoribacter lunatus]
MGLTASLDIGSDKMVMAVAGTDGREECRLSGIKMIALQGVKDGVIVDKAKVKSYIQYLLKELVKDKPVDVFNMSLAGKAVRVSEHKVSVSVQRKTVRESDLGRAENACRELVTSKGGEVVDMIPIAYSTDRGEYTDNPLGRTARTLEVRFRVYVSDSLYLKEVRQLLEECGIRNVHFFSVARAYMEALDVHESKARFALLDLGAAHVGVMLFRNGMLEHEVLLPLGCNTIEGDIKSAFRLGELSQAKKMKQLYGGALRSVCKSGKVQIPDTNKQVDRRDLVKVIQCRLEELLEGALYQLQQWRFTENDKEILLTGGGCRMSGTDALLSKLSGQKVGYAKAKRITAIGEEILQAPACLVVLGLLLCEHLEPVEEKSGITGWLSNLFK